MIYCKKDPNLEKLDKGSLLSREANTRGLIPNRGWQGAYYNWELHGYSIYNMVLNFFD